MKLNNLIDILTSIERKHGSSGRVIEVESRDSAGFPMGEFVVTAECVFAAQRITVRFEPTGTTFQPIRETCAECKHACSSDCCCWCHGRDSE